MQQTQKLNATIITFRSISTSRNVLVWICSAGLTLNPPAGPDCPRNRNYLRRLRHALITRSSPPEFPTSTRFVQQCFFQILQWIAPNHCFHSWDIFIQFHVKAAGGMKIHSINAKFRESNYRGRVGLADLLPKGRVMMGWPENLEPATKMCTL